MLARTPPATLPVGARLVMAPTAGGLILFRTLFPEAAALSAPLALQPEQRCAPFQPRD